MCSVGQNQPGLGTAVLEVSRGTQAKRELGTHNSSYPLSPGPPLPGLSLPRNGQQGRAEEKCPACCCLWHPQAGVGSDLRTLLPDTVCFIPADVSSRLFPRVCP